MRLFERMPVTTTNPRGLRLLLTRRWIGYLVLALVFAVACVSLGMWQFARLEESRTQIARVKANYDSTPVVLESVITTLDSFTLSDSWKQVTASGRYLDNQQILVRSRPLNGDVGFEVLAPLRLSDGRIFIVDRGWIPSGDTTAVASRVPQPPAGDVTVIARLKPSEPALAGRDAVDGTVPTIHLPMIRELIRAHSADAPVIVGAYGLVVSESPAVTEMPTPAEKPELDEGPHLSYALQWLIFAVMGFVGLGLAVRNERRISAGLKEADNRPVIARRRTDESDEDAILDGR